MKRDSIEAIHNLSSQKREQLRKLLRARGVDLLTLPVFRRPADLAVIPASFAQQRIWFLDQLDSGNPAYNVPATVRLVGRLDVDVLTRALNEVVRRHDVLRTTFAVVDDVPVQVVAPTLALELPQTDLSTLPQGQRVPQADELARQEAWIPFDLVAGPLVRGRLLRMAEDEHILLLTVHHVVSDEWSMGVLAHEVAALYAAYKRGEPSPLPPLPIQYADYAHWQRCWLGDEVLQAQVDYWKQQLADVPPVSTLPSDRPRPPMQTHRGATLVLRLPAHITAGLHAVALQAQGTLFMVLAAAFNVLLWRHSGQDDLCIGMPVASRTRAELEPLIGLFVNTLVLRTRLPRGATFIELLQQVKATTLDAYAHQDVPFEQLVEVLRPQRDTAYSPLFQVMLALQNAPVQSHEPAGLCFEPLGRENTQAQFDLTLNITDEGEQLRAEFEYNTDLFDASSIERLAGHFTRLLEGVIADPQQRIGQLQLLDDAERDRMLVQWNGAATDYPQSTVHQLFEEQAKRAPEAVAVVYEEAALTYAELNARANRLASFLRDQRVGPDTRVAICVERGVNMVVGLLAILKAGGAYVPLDPSYPAERLAYVLHDCRPTVLLSDAACAHRLPVQDGVPVFKLDDEARWCDLPADDLSTEALGLKARHLAYVIYTSGSTGTPKGVQVAHVSVVNYVLAAAATYALTSADRVLQANSISFDIAVDEIFATLAAGATLVLPPWPRLPAIVEFIALIERRKLTVLNLPTAYWHEWVAALEPDPAPLPQSLRLVVVGGEAVSASRLQRWRTSAGERVVWINSYGPTESTAGVTFGCVGADEPVHIGSPISNTHLYVLDAWGQPAPIGAPGEIYIGGVQLARGYLNRPDLTAERFVPDPYAGEQGARMYKTGDVARWRADGTIEFLGRNDDQVKIRGFRIELGEIEARLSQHSDVREAVVLAREDAFGDKRLVAYVTGEKALTPEALRVHLAAQLPEYMVPAAYVQLDEMPLTPNGKLDRKALPAPEVDALALAKYTPPQTKTERAVAAIWSDLLALPIEHIGRDGDFFALGGHSLLAVRVASQVRQALQRTLPLREIFAHRTVRELSAHLDESMATDPPLAIEPVPRDSQRPLAPVQERLWVVHQMQGLQASYNMALALQLKGPLSMPALQAAFDLLLQRHEPLRTRFVADADGQPRQVIEPTQSLHVPVRQARREEVPALAETHAQQVFDLGRAPLLSVQVLQLDEQEHVLLLNMHHIISDGWSINVLAYDMQQLYAAQLRGVPALLPALGVQYADYAHWLRQQDMAVHAAYWAQTLHGYEPGLTLPLDRPAQPRPSVARTLTVDYPADLCAAMGTWCMQHGGTLFMALTAALGVVLQRYTSRRDLCVGTTVAGRERAELEPLIGFFINIVALRLDLSGDPSAGDLLERVKGTVLPALEHQALPFEQVLQQLKLSSGSAQELVPVMVRHQNVPDTVGSQWSDGLTVAMLPGSEQSAKCPLDLQFFGDARGLSATVEYAADLFDEATVRRLLQHHQQVLHHMVQHPRQPLSLLTVLTADERQLIVHANRTARGLDDALSLVAQFEQQVQARPEACACLDEQGQLSYAELNARANRIARALRERGVGPEVRVGLYMPRSCDFIAAMLGIFKAGGVYVPLDVNAPPAYLQRLIDDAQPQVLMHGAQPPQAACAGIEVLSVAEASSQGPETNLAVPWQAQQLMMLAYTSGSTGQPKGVLVPHGQLLNLLRSMQTRLPLERDDVVAQKTMAPFVVSMKELWGALLAGVPQVVLRDALLKDPPAFIAALQRGRVSRLFIVPSHLQAVLEVLDDPSALSHLRVCVTAGEPLTQQLRERVQRTLPWVALWNNYGCTELNDTAYCGPEHLGGAGQFVPIGWPIDNVQVHVLDERLRELPLGVVGELCVHTPWMARGYWRQPELTAERFVPNPYGPPGSRLYRTGDMVRRLADGALEYLGRQDFDIKIRGQRVDVRQVEAALARCEGVQLAAAGAWSDDRGDTRLVAYVVPQVGRPLQAAVLRRELAAQLPAFMVPSLYVPLEALPRTTTGKLDRKSLPAPQGDALAQQPYTAPEIDTERALATIWSQFLELPVERIGRDDDFFALGGHSLLATRIAAQVQQALQRPLQLQDIFAHATLRELAAHVDTLADAVLPPTIEPRGHQDDVELSFAQQRLWFLHRWDAQSSAYHNTVAVKVSERLDEALVERTLDALVRRHEALRTRFPDIEGRAVQRVAEHAKVPIECINLSDLEDEARREAEAREATQAAITRPFDLAHGPLLRLQLVRLGAQGSLLTLVVHHIVADGWSMNLLIQELLTLYGAFSRQQPDPLPPLAIQYPDYAVWQRSYLQGEVLQRQQRYWSGQLADAPVLLALPTDRPRPVMQSYGGRALHRRLDRELAERLRAFAQSQQLTPFMVLLSAFNVLLYRYSGQSDIVVGTPVANRHHPGLEQLIGMFANTLALRSRVESTQTFANLLAQVRQTTMAAQAHQDLPFEQLVDLLQVPRSTSHSPLFQVMFSLLSLTAQRQDEDPDTGTAGWQAHETAREASQFDLMLSLEESPHGFAARWEFNSDLFDAATIERMAGHFERLLRHGLAEPQVPLQRLEMLDAPERDELVHRFNDTATAYEPQCVHQLIEAQVERAPQAIAVVFEEGTLNYAELNEQANRLAHYLRSLGVGPDDRVAVCVARGLSMVVALVAVLKAGAAYVPLDPDYPAERLAFMIEDCRPRVVLTQAATRAALGAGAADCGCVLDLDDPALWVHMPASNLPPQTDASGLAYVIYTSGSTGTPKGVMVTHANIASLFSACDPWFGFGADDVWTLFHSFAFDFSVWELWGALMHGGRVVIVPRRVAQSPKDFYALLCEQRVTVLNQTPSAFLQLMHAQAESTQSHTLRYVIFGGEALDISALKPWFTRNDPPAPQLINMYGITETTVHVTYRPVRLQDTEVLGPSPIGVPIAGLRVYVLDPCGAPVPMGVAGELHVAGNGLARGYLNRADLTAERFVPDPFCERPGERMYKSGDLARLRADGSLEYLGRNDHQVKIRGFRIELGEIEARLLAAPGVREGRVVAREFGPGDRRLVAYYASDAPVSLSGLRDALSSNLPEHMVPAAYVRVDVFPLTVNGKLDVARLPAPDAESFVSRDWEAPEGDVEALLATIWGELLGLERVGRRDNFFELGGHSFLAVRLIERMRDAGLGLDVRAVFAAPTLQALAAQAMPGRVLEVPPNRIPPGCTAITPDMLTLVDLSQEEIAAIVEAAPGGAANIQDIYPLAPLQEGVLFLHLMREEAGDYLWTTMLSFDTRAKLDPFIAALQALIDRHDILRTAMHWDGLAEPVQVVYRGARLPVEELSLRAEDGSVDAQMMERHGLSGFWLDVTRPPLLRTFIAHDAANACWKLQIVLHHLISDHRAINILIEEVHAILHGQPLAPVPAFRNLVAQARLGVRREEHEAFFRDMLSHVDEPTAPFGLLNVPEARTDIRHSGKVRLPTALGERLRKQARELKVSVASLFHLAWARLLSSAAGRDEVVFGTFLFGRLQGGAGADRTPGMFINILPICVRVGVQGVADAVRETHALLTQLLRHEHAPLPLALRCSGVHPPKLLFSAVLNYRHGDYAKTGEQLELDMQQVDERNHYPFTLMVDDMGDGFLLTACTSAAVDPRRVCDYTETVLEHLVDALENAAQMPLAALNVLPSKERALIAQWSAVGVPHGCELINRRIAAHARRMPETIAVEHQGQRLSYAELDARAERLAAYLRAEGVGPDVPVGICVERSIHMIVGLLAILKAGGAYLPLDPGYPQERLAYIVKDSGPAMVLAMPATVAAARSIAGDLRVVDLADDVPRRGPGRHADDDQAQVLPQHVAYVIYTSGSTGVPKGVQVSHGNLASYVEAAIGAYALRPSDRVLQFSSLSFDLSVEEIFATLGGGATLVLAPWPRLPSIAEFHRTVERAQLTMLSLPTAYWHEWAAELGGMDKLSAQSLRLVVVGGERALEQRYREWHAAVGDGVEWINTYGPTEATVIATLARASGNDPVHIGRPIAGTTAYILDARNLPVPPGAPGELCIGGAQVARGYRNRPDLTAERFVPDPFDPTPGARMYRTGDRARYRDDGTIEYLGRFDDQVKLRGFRIEPEEIRAVLGRMPWVREALVTVHEGADNQSRLVAHVVQQPGVEMPPLRDVRDALAQTLPAYMVPAHVVFVPRFPLTPNGKIDRKALPPPDVDGAASSHDAPSTPIEELICSVWAEVLGRRQVGAQDNFFDLGGHSLLALQAMSRLSRRLGREVPVHLLFATQTVSVLAQEIEAATHVDHHARGLVAIRGAGALAPLFIVHAGDGEVGYAFALAPHLPADRPLYALAATGFAEGETPLASVEQMASSYLRALRRVQPHGPYHVLGWSAGGTIAYEMAAQLLAAGEQVGFVGVIDTLSDYGVGIRSGSEELTEADVFIRHLRDQLDPDLADQLATFGARGDIDAMFDLCQARGLIPATIERPTLRRHLAVRHAIDTAVASYRTRPLKAQLSVFAAADEPRRDFSLGWAEIAGHGIELVALPGTHWSLVQPSHNAALGAAIAQALAARGRGGMEHRDAELTASTF